FGFNIFVCIVLISNTPLFLLFLTYFFKVSGQVLFNTATAMMSKNQEKSTLKYYFSDVGGYVEFFNCLNAIRVDVVYEAGYDNVPEQIKLGIMRHVSALYKNRESEVSSHLSEVKKVYSPFREPKVVL
ncbi:MAG: phage gp6-like head-tail connector protein, partial [Wolbachia endosymbiont of Halictus tumulorum]|nr:phage gp6-like head-tail connector protein [Wolbachia endosymbiont of Halictus tumulorum]